MDDFTAFVAKSLNTSNQLHLYGGGLKETIEMKATNTVFEAKYIVREP